MIMARQDRRYNPVIGRLLIRCLRASISISSPLFEGLFASLEYSARQNYRSNAILIVLPSLCRR